MPMHIPHQSQHFWKKLNRSYKCNLHYDGPIITAVSAACWEGPPVKNDCNSVFMYFTGMRAQGYCLIKLSFRRTNTHSHVKDLRLI